MSVKVQGVVLVLLTIGCLIGLFMRIPETKYLVFVLSVGIGLFLA